MRDEVQRVVALRVGDGRVCAVRYEQLDDVEVAVTGGPLHRRRNEVAALGVNLCTLV